MLFGYGARNCWCFKDWLDIDLRLNGYVPKEITQGKNFATVLGFKGANASGKTNALKIFAFIADFAQNSFLYPTDSKILFDSFFLNKENSEFYVEFAGNGIEYRYECTLSKDKVINEVLFEIKNTGDYVLFRRNFNEILENRLYDNATKIIYRDNASFISTLHQYGIKNIHAIYDFFNKKIINVTYKGLRHEIDRNIPAISNSYFHNKDALQFTKNLIKKFDTGISDIEISFREDEVNGKSYFPIFYHDNAGSIKKLIIDQESSGTKALYIDLFFYYANLESGGVLILDEFDINLHPDILPHLIKLFTDNATNPLSAQMLFTSHNAEILDILGKYRAYIVEKEGGESFAYRLDEPKTNILRNDRSISIPYRQHFLGGYPKVEA